MKKAKVEVKPTNICEKCDIVKIKKATGIMIEILGDIEDKRKTLDFLLDAQNEGFNVFVLKHKENDMSVPKYLTLGGVVNRYGWFVTKETMYHKGKPIIEFTADDWYLLSSKNLIYYDLVDGDLIEADRNYQTGYIDRNDALEYIRKLK